MSNCLPNELIVSISEYMETNLLKYMNCEMHNVTNIVQESKEWQNKYVKCLEEKSRVPQIEGKYNWKKEFQRVNKYKYWHALTDSIKRICLGKIIDKKITDLPVLNLSHYEMKNMPKEIGQLIKLEGLYTDNNKIRVFPNEICKLINLKCLDLGSNKIEHLPNEICNLIHLQFLYLCGNKITDLPKHFDKLKELQSLSLSNNKLIEFPHQVTNLPNLANLHLHNNKIKTIPVDIIRLKFLHTLEISFNKLTYLPFELTNMINLRCCIVYNNEIKNKEVFENNSIFSFYEQ